MRPTYVATDRPLAAAAAAARHPIALWMAVAAISLATPAAAGAAAPAPCNGVAQISDPAADAHHGGTDILAGWFSEQAGRLQGVIQVRQGLWQPDVSHEDDGAGFALLFEVGGARHYVRLVAPRNEAPRFDYGTWTAAGSFVSAGPTTGELVTGTGGTVTIDVPAATGAVAGARLAKPFVLTFDGFDGAEPHWVDGAPGGTTPAQTDFGADYVVGSCQAPGPGGGGGPGSGGGGGGEPPTAGGDVALATTSVVLNAPARLVGGGTARASGRIFPARGGINVRVTAKARRSRAPAVVRDATTRADGTYAVSVPISETSRITAVAEGINAQTRTVTVRSTVTLTLRRLADGRTSVSGRVSPRLPGRILVLRANAVAPSATSTARAGRFRLRARSLRPGRYQAVFIPSVGRAERSTSKSGVVR